MTDCDYLSGTIIAQELDLEPIQVRKDLAITGIIGKPKRGYPAKELMKAIEQYLGWDIERSAILIGAGNLGSALLGYPDFKNHGLRFKAAFDSDPRKIGSQIHGVPVFDTKELESGVRDLGAVIAIVTVPSSEAQSTADRLVACGIQAIWNFSNAKLSVPSGVAVYREDLSSGYALLSVMMRGKR